MIVLDTNVISELMRPVPNAVVLDWVAAQPRSLLYTTSVTRAEILYGVAGRPSPLPLKSMAATHDAGIVAGPPPIK